MMTKSYKARLAEIEAELIDGIAEERKRKGFTQEELSKKLGASSNLMNKLEAHTRGLEAALLVMLAEAMNMSEGTLVQRAKSHAKKARGGQPSSKNVKD